MKKKPIEKDEVDKEIEWILKNGLKFAEGRFGHQVVVIKDRKVIFRVKGDEEEEAIAVALATAGIPLETPEEVQIRDIGKALCMVKDKFGDPELVNLHVFGDGEAIASLHFKNGLILYVFGFTAM